MALRKAGTGLVQRLACQQGTSIFPATLAACDIPSSQLLNGQAFSPTVVSGARHASNQAIKGRIKSVQNIQKITKAMKMVAASKMRVAQLDTENSRGIVKPFYRLLGDHPAAEVEKNVTIPITSDKGLCGGINSTVAKLARTVLKVTEGEGKNAGLVVFGEKGRAQLIRDRKERIIETVVDVGKVKITFAQVSLLAEDVLKTEYDATRVIFNRFKSAISFLPTMATVLSPDTLEKEAEAGSAVDAYEIEGPDRAELLQDLAEFQLAATLYNGLLENNCSEQASRMAAMENSTKNASEMLSELTLFYNRARQATITTELIEIISGAAALEG